MPWEKSFDEDEAVGKAMKVFWEKGFEAASLADLIAGTGITRGSLYNAFGGKEQLFIRTLRKYDKDKRRVMLAELEAMDDPERAITALFDGIVAESLADAEKKGCFLVNTASEFTTHSEEINSIVRNGLRETEAFLRRSLEVGQARQQFPNTLDPAPTAKALMAMIVAIRVLARGLFDEASLKTIAAQAQRLLR
ncbi:TetR/AcrR family transcriptional regulator [Denitromonas ohlonensis]|jgi:TetR/AcrR family transcriptional repressor of nem operon|uniref:Helix-turn-helix transcriptional regulator n=2 Tax=Denitromonas TaxID=139331 RepID=A0A558CQQ3_9RHOO|nr:TetR/AcrR family transcriptional regulator [Denitromonas ohlonensis]TVT51109.1 MAG: helix-turn-helix transcriptional regulator [Denitromonas halophila]TVO68439.1 helix-turn-helix transcriptional regulator [Denitromonas ohlonensis]TVO74717.1 helix-turn-helix transcriptional regulator [Denitromonas ohlonensis]TVT71258.1 MAG: helix-turn-helix transcriptional regulator [Denitromonas halophila]TVT72264.1 MAG: helix-turn-helix transcriptional regulator [Denitromonas halophila]